MTAEGARTPGRPRGGLFTADPYFARRSPWFVSAVGVLLVLAIVVADVSTGPNITPSLFYLLPVALVAWRVRRGVWLAIAALAAAAWTSSQLLLSEYTSLMVASFNIAVRFGVLCIVGGLLVFCLRSS